MVHLFSKMVSFFASTCRIWLAVGANDNTDQSGQLFEQYDISKVPEKIFSDDFLMACRQKMFIFGIIKACISYFTNYNLYQMKLKVITRKKYALYFLIRPLDFFLETREDSIHLHGSPKKNLEADQKMKGILLPRNCFKFPLVKVIPCGSKTASRKWTYYDLWTVH